MSMLPAVNLQQQSEFYQKAFAFQDFLLNFEQAEIPVFHHFSLGAYERECHLPAHTYVIGKVHRHAHINIISKGRVLLATPTGFQLLTAPCQFINEVGVKRVLYVLEDTVWTTVHKNSSNTQDLAKIEADVIVPEHEVDAFAAQLYAPHQTLGETQ
jgi:hypothetical protein